MADSIPDWTRTLDCAYPQETEDAQQWQYGGYMADSWPGYDAGNPSSIPEDLLPVDLVDFSTVHVDAQRNFAPGLPSRPILSPPYEEFQSQDTGPVFHSYNHYFASDGPQPAIFDHVPQAASDESYVGLIQHASAPVNLHPGFYVDSQWPDLNALPPSNLQEEYPAAIPFTYIPQHAPAPVVPEDQMPLPYVGAASTEPPGIIPVQKTVSKPPPKQTKLAVRTAKRSRPSKESLAAPKTRTRRTGPLSGTARDKADAMRLLGACWRCRRYRKPCNDAVICDNCFTSGFRVWPSQIGCFRGNLDTLASPLMPDKAETIFVRGLMLEDPKRPNWRLVQFPIPAHDFEKGTDWERLEWKVLGTRMFGQEFSDFFDIVVQYQKSRSIRHPLVDAACAHLSATSNFYHAFIATDVWFPSPDLYETLKEFRSASARLWSHFVKYALSGRRSEWFPLFLTSLITLCSVVIWTDAALAMPESGRSQLWVDLQAMVIDLRTRLMKVALHLHSISTGGTKPWTMSCWIKEEHDRSDGEKVTERNTEGMKLLGQDRGSFDGVMAFQRWLKQHGSVIDRDGKIWFSNKPFTMQNILPMSCIWGFLNM
ncbi:MAG: hypothetical protein M1818_007966 [Claussenomyces sp. TS43310]|nr:MAG: hypothetical protein M1818_007966 [Claussenomyces sp. TS43310]